MSELDSMVLRILVSSANVAIFEFVTTSGGWFSYKRNNKKPRIDACGTPDVTGTGRDVAPRTVVCWYRFVRWETIPFRIWPQTQIHEDDELVLRDLLYQKPLTCLNTVHQFSYHGPTHDPTDQELQSIG